MLVLTLPVKTRLFKFALLRINFLSHLVFFVNACSNNEITIDMIMPVGCFGNWVLTPDNELFTTRKKKCQ